MSSFKSSLQFIYFMSILCVANLKCGCDTNRQLSFMKNLHHEMNQEQSCDISSKIHSSSCNRDDYDEVQKTMSVIPSGSYIIGTDNPVFVEDGESPSRLVKIDRFLIDKYEISNEEFEKFVNATNYTTDAETFGDSFIFKSFLTKEEQDRLVDMRVVRATWWYKVQGINWKSPFGVGSKLEGYYDHPVVHVSWKDANAYCTWKNKRLPTENEWEVACRGGKKNKLFPWGNKELPRDTHWMNIWHGEFPNKNTADDSYNITCPVTKFRQNDYDLYNIIGNVWEWTSDEWNLKTGINYDYKNRVKKGGSYMCHKSYCYRYRCAARSYNTEDSSASNLGFRCAKSI